MYPRDPYARLEGESKAAHERSRELTWQLREEAKKNSTLLKRVEELEDEVASLKRSLAFTEKLAASVVASVSRVEGDGEDLNGSQKT